MMDPASWTTYVQTASWAGGTLTAAVGIWKFGQDNRKSRTQREKEIDARKDATMLAARELEWRRANSAQLVLEKMESDEAATDAMLMLDWDGREYSSADQHWCLTKADVLTALRTEGAPFEPQEIYVRDAFDHLFWHFERIQHQIDVELITPEHVKFPIGYLLALMQERHEVYEGFLKAYCYDGCIRLWALFRGRGLPRIHVDSEKVVRLDQVRQPTQ